jgi:hypothetical protein
MTRAPKWAGFKRFLTDLMLYAVNNGWQVCELSGCAVTRNICDERANNDAAITGDALRIWRTLGKIEMGEYAISCVGVSR